MEIKNKELIDRINQASQASGLNPEQLIESLMVSEEIILPALNNIEEVVKTELVSRSASQIANLRALRTQVLNLHADGMESDARAIAFARQANEIAEEFIDVNGAELLKDQPFFAQRHLVEPKGQIMLEKAIYEALENEALGLNISVNEMLNHVLRVVGDIPTAIVRLEKLFSFDLVVNYIVSMSEIEALRAEVNALYSSLNNNPEKAKELADKATEHGLKSVLKKSKLEA